MGPTQRGVIFVLTVVSVALVGALGVRAIRAPEVVPWPGRVAVIGVDPQDGRDPITYLGIADPVRQAVVTVPADAVVEIPGSGFLRAYHAWRLGGADLVRSTLGRLFGVDVPFSVVGEGDSFEAVARSFTVAEVPADSVDALRQALERDASSWPRHDVSGDERQGVRGTFVVLDPSSVSAAANAIGGLGTRVFVDPTDLDTLVEGTPGEPDGEATDAPAETIAPATITIDVLNGGGVTMAATRTAERLRGVGYTVGRISDLEPQDRAQSFVYYREGKEPAAAQVGAELGYEIRPIEDGIPIRSTADLVVVLGDDAQV